MSKKAYLLLSVVASLALGGVLFATPESKNLRAEDPTSYTKSITLTSSQLTGSSSAIIHDAYTITVGGLPITIGTGVYPSSGKIYLKGNESGGTTISFPAVTTGAGAHGVGYASIALARPSSGTYGDNVVLSSYDAANASTTTAITLSKTAPVTTATPTGYVNKISLASTYENSSSTAFTSITVTYTCVSA
jgi:hypothetical protein